MDKNSFIGIDFCISTNGHYSAFDYLELVSYAKSLNIVTVVWYISEISLSDSNRVVFLIKEKKITRIIIAGEEPGHRKPFFTKAIVSAGKAPENVVLASFKKYGALTKGDTKRAKAILACSIYGIPFETAVAPEEATVNPDTVVIGAGISGIQASLEIAKSGTKVYLVEKTGTKGGHMAKFDKTNPSLDYAACISTLKMVQVGQHTNIEFLTFSC